MDLMCITGEAGGFRDDFGAEKKKEKKTSSNTSRCSNVATSSQQKKKSTLGCHLNFCLIIIKSKGDLIW